MLSNKKGFTLTEMVVVLVILAILAAFAIPTMLGYISSSQEKLCNVTRMDMVRLYKTSLIGKEASASKAGFESFAKENWGSLSQCPNGGAYTFSASLGDAGQINAEILCSKHGLANILTVDQVTMGTGGHTGFIKGSYSGSIKDIIVPKNLGGNIVTEIYQDVFKSKGLTSVIFQNDNEITRIHARAFWDNSLTKIDLPDNLKRIDWGAFSNNKLTEIVLPDTLEEIEGGAFAGNNITKITIGSNVIMKDDSFQNMNNFKTVYNTTGDTGGAGTYVYTEGVGWKKQ